MGFRKKLFLVLVLVLFVLAAAAQAQEADLIVTKSGPAIAAAGSDVTYTIDVLNGGADDAASVTVVDFIPSGMTWVSDSAAPGFICTHDTLAVTCTSALLAAGTTATFTFTFNIPGATPPGTTFTNTATATTETFDPNDENNTSSTSTSTPGPPQPDMFAMKSGPSAAGQNTDVSYTITIGNASPDIASNVAFSDTLPGTMTFVSFTQNSGPAFICSGTTTTTCTAASFPANAAATFTFVGHIPPGTPSGTSFDNIVNVSADNDQNTGNNQSSVITVVSAVDVSVDKTGPPSVNGGDDVAYTITLANAGPDSATDAAFADTLPPNTTFVSLVQNTGPSASCSPLAPGDVGTVGCSIGLLGPGASAQFTLTVKAGNALSITNTANASTSGFDTNNANDSDSATTSVIPIADLAVVKTGPASVVAGTDLTYTITATNDGPSAATTVSVTDAMPAGTTYVSATPSQGSCSGTTNVLCDLGTIGVGASATITLIVHVDVAYAGPVVNTAQGFTTTTDPVPDNNTSTVTTTVTPAPVDLSITKTADPDPAIVGEHITYTITVTNNGPGTATNTTVTDTIPANTTFVSASASQGTCSGNPLVTCSLGTLTAGSSATVTLVVNAPATPQAVVNVASVSSSETEGNPGNNTATSTVNAAVPVSPAVPTLSTFAMALLALGLGLAMVLKAR